MVLDQSCAVDQAHLRSHSGPGVSDALSVRPSKQEYRIEAGFFRTLTLEIAFAGDRAGVRMRDHVGQHRSP